MNNTLNNLKTAQQVLSLENEVTKYVDLAGIITHFSCVLKVSVSLNFVPLEMIYHKLANLLILHHLNYMHDTNHKVFTRVVMGLGSW